MAKKPGFFDCRERSAVRSMAKGQAAIEFLTTYGWAILALIIVLGVLVTSGILAPNYLVSEECAFGTNFRCSTVLLNPPGGAPTQVLLTFSNGFPYKIRIDGVELATSDGQTVSFTTPTSVDSGGNTTFKGVLSAPRLPDKSTKKLTGNLTYVSCAPEIGGCSDASHVVSGRITAKVLAQ